MLCNTHELIAERLYKLTNRIIDVPFDYKSFLLGSVAPDKKPSMLVIPHTKTHSINLLNKNLDFLCKRNISFAKDSIELLSYRLGIVIHLLSDYFCSAHNHIKFINPVPHLLYENRLKLYFKKNIDMMKIDIEDCLLEINNNLNDYIDKMHMEYIIADRNMLNDFNYTINTVSSVFIYILCSLLNNGAGVDISNINSQAYITAC